MLPDRPVNSRWRNTSSYRSHSCLPRGIDVLTVDSGQLGETAEQIADVPEVGVEAIAAVGVARDDPFVASGAHATQQRNLLDLVVRDAILFQESR